MDLAGKTVIVLGATGNLGSGVAAAALDAGARVVLPTRSAEGAASLRRDFRDRSATVLLEDVSDPAAADRLADRLRGLRWRFDHVVASMGSWWAGGAFVEQEPAEYETVRRMMLDSHVHAARTLLPLVDVRGSYTLVTAAGSVAPVTGVSLLTVAGGGLLALSRVLRFEHCLGARVNELRIAARVERAARPGVVGARELGQAVLTLLQSNVRGAVVPFTSLANFAPGADLDAPPWPA